jgi:ATP-dependent DNA helicase PIF1
MSAISEPLFPCFSTPNLQQGFSSLSVEQKYSFAKFMQGQNLFVTGPGGTGKTRLIQFMVEYMNSIGKPHQVCALTGCAATLLNCKAKTIHSWSGIKLGKGVPEDIIRRVVKGRCYPKAWRAVEVLIVDEVSMMSRKMFDLLDQIGRTIRKCNTKPFGGIQLVFTGDFFQLPPIPDYDDPTSGEFCFKHPKWGKTFKPENCIELKTFFRQTDPAYISILQEVRRGTISPANIELLQSRLTRGRVTEPKNGVVPTKLFPVRSKVETINESSYEKLEGEEKIYRFSVTTKAKTHIDSGTALSSSELAHCEELTSDQLSQEVDNLITSLFTEKVVRLKIGTLVMCTANIEVDKGICNGSQGVVVGYAEATSPILPDELIAKKTGPALVPVVKFANGVTMKVAPYQRQSEEFPCIVVAQVPLCLAWALTIHKIQGATLDMAEMDIGRSVFADGQSYVALSRVKTLDGLYLSEFNSTKIRANPLVIEFYDSFLEIGKEEMSRQTVDILTNIRPAVHAVEMKQTSMQSFIPAPNPFSVFSNKSSDELKEEEPIHSEEKKDPTIKTIKLSKY